MREPDAIRRRTLARLALSSLLAGALVGTLAPAAAAKVPRLVFPVVGKVAYQNDFGDARGQGSHEGNDILAAWRAPAVAAEPGRVTIWTSSARAGCMLYLHGRSGTTYLYIHLNNDLTKRNDNKGGCKEGVAYAPGLADGERVRAGELLGYVGDSGDADGIAYHLHFEVHPDDGRAVSPYRHLRAAEKLLFALPEPESARGPQATVALSLVGTVVGYEAQAPANGGSGPGSGGNGSQNGSNAPPPPPPPSRDSAAQAGLLTLRVTAVRVVGGSLFRVTRRVVVTVPAGTRVERPSGDPARFADLEAGAPIVVTTTAVRPTLASQRARPGQLVVAAARLR